ncbi:aminotransferase class I/II-fold pyridoxal phosphate-dependent enzyme [Rhodoplanes sp. SY1]|uniref:aminotransferase class I/II-fold pyridoxal phosphate-dependent enzyme n=1 Tax=Rhodoplanes sp. SY1 TaxID=3166646 RepID=UPI0038B5FB74
MSMTSAASAPSASPARPPETRSPFVRLTELLAGVVPAQAPINLSIGEPQHPIPPFVKDALVADLASLGRYPAGKGTDSFREAAAGWLTRRYGLPRAVDAASEVLVLCGTREGLFLGAIAAKRWVEARRGPLPGKPAILVPNPFYAAYPAGGTAADCDVVYMPAWKQNGFLPDLDALDDALLARTVALYIASPANPQGAVADLDYLARLLALARKHGFLVFADECYSEIYTRDAPPGILQAAGADFSNAVVFQSLSKRSNLPGLRVGFAAGDAAFLQKFLDLRNVAAPQVPGVAQAVAAAAYADEDHVEENRRLYARKFDLADQIVGDRWGYVRPAGGFYLWLDVAALGGSEAVTLKLWRDAGVRVLPGRYIARDQADGSNPGADYIRLAMVQNEETTAEALHRLVAVLG